MWDLQTFCFYLSFIFHNTSIKILYYWSLIKFLSTKFKTSDISQNRDVTWWAFQHHCRKMLNELIWFFGLGFIGRSLREAEILDRDPKCQESITACWGCWEVLKCVALLSSYLIRRLTGCYNSVIWMIWLTRLHTKCGFCYVSFEHFLVVIYQSRGTVFTLN